MRDRAVVNGCGHINVATHKHVSIDHNMARSEAFCRTIWRGLARLSFVGKHWYSSESVKRFSELGDLHPFLLEKLTQQKLLELTDIQGKVPVFMQFMRILLIPFPIICRMFLCSQCLPDLLSETSYTKSCIINAETGSGKTLCEYV